MAAGLLLASGISVLAQDAAGKPSPSGLPIKNKSVFNADPKMHNPFWPIGWAKKGPVAVAAPVEAAPVIVLKPEMFNVSTIMLGSPAIAVINGREYEEGQTLRQEEPKAATAGRGTESAPSLPPSAKVQVVRILDGAVVLRCGESQVSVELKRK